MKTSNFEDLTDWLSEHKLTVAIGILGAIAIGNIAMGGGAKLSAKFDQDEQKQTVAQQQADAEEMYKAQGCSAQFLNAATNKTGLTEGAIAIDPVTSAPFSGGLLCSTDGGVWQVKPGGQVHFIGASPLIRKVLVETGAATAAKEMEQKFNRK